MTGAARRPRVAGVWQRLGAAGRAIVAGAGRAARPSVVHELMLGLGLGGVLTLGLLLLVGRALLDTADGLAALVDGQLPVLAQGAALQADLAALVATTAGPPDRPGIATAQAVLETTATGFGSALAAAGLPAATATAVDTRLAGLVGRARALAGAEVAGGFGAAAGPGREAGSAAGADAWARIRADGIAVLAEVEAALAAVMSAAADRHDATQTRFRQRLAALALLPPLLLGIALATWFYLRRALLDPIRRLHAALDAVRAGRPAAFPPARRDEIGAIVEAVRDFSSTLAERERQLREASATAERANRAKGLFLAHLSHDLRTPLHAILGYADLIRQAPGLDATTRERAGIIRRSGTHLLQLINDLLDLAAIEAGRLRPTPVDVPLLALLDELGATLGRSAVVKGLDFRIEPAPGLPARVHIDGRRLRQVLVNLLDNAVKFTTRGSVVLRCRVPMARDGAPWLCFEVVDSGPGIDPAVQARLFEPFEQGNLNQPGSGLGLAISRDLATLLGGTLTLTSTPGCGSCFRLEVPVGYCTGSACAAPGGARIGGYAGPRRRVLVVDDDATNRLLLEHLLDEVGFTVDLADGADAALARGRLAVPDLVVMDLVMPGTSGYAATHALRAALGRPGLPVIAISATALGSAEDARGLGFDAFLLKPVARDLLLAAIGDCLGLDWRFTAPGGLEPARAPCGRAGVEACGAGPCREPGRRCAAAAGAGDATRLAASADTEALEPPPRSEIETIAERVRLGDWQAAADWCEDLASGQPELAPFAGRVRALVDRGDGAALLGWLERLC